MSVCVTEHWVLDCGDGGCALWEGADGQVFFWKCYPQVVSANQGISARRKSPGQKRLSMNASEKTTLCYQHLDRTQIADVVREVTGRSVALTQVADEGKKTLCQTGTFDELLQACGLRLQD